MADKLTSRLRNGKKNISYERTKLPVRFSIPADSQIAASFIDGWIYSTREAGTGDV